MHSIPNSLCFYSFRWDPYPDHMNNLVSLTIFMLEDLVDSTILPRKKLNETIVSIAKACRDNPYRNFEHSFMASHAFYYIQKQNPARFSQLEILGSFIGILGHTIDNCVMSNRFLKLTNDPLIELYGDIQCEKHHAIFLIQSITDLYHSFDHLSSEQYKNIMEIIQTTILTTIGYRTLHSFNKLKVLLTNNSFYWNNIKHKELVRILVVHSSDQYIFIKSYESAKRYVHLIHNERQNEVFF